MSQRTRHDAGFTLVELLVVMVVIGVLVSIAVPALLTQRDKAREAASKQDLESLAAELDTALVDGPAGAVTRTVLDNSTGGTLDTVIVYGGESYPVRLSPGQVVSYALDATGDYCVDADHASPGARPWRVRQGNVGANGLSQGACP
jgi:prepilin-type N-terminal cleavage/methylation domain-containing protein